MGLLQRYTDRSGLDIVDAYHKVCALEWNGGEDITVSVKTFVSKNKSDERAPPVAMRRFSLPFAKTMSESAVKQVYDALKSKDEFSSAQDA